MTTRPAVRFRAVTAVPALGAVLLATAFSFAQTAPATPQPVPPPAGTQPAVTPPPGTQPAAAPPPATVPPPAPAPVQTGAPKPPPAAPVGTPVTHTATPPKPATQTPPKTAAHPPAPAPAAPPAQPAAVPVTASPGVMLVEPVPQGPTLMLGGWPISSEAADFTEQAAREFRAHHFNEAVQSLELASKADPHQPAVWNNLGSGYLAVDQSVYGERAFKKAIKLAPNFALAHYNLGAAYDLRFAYDKAIEEYARAAELDPSMLDARKNPAVVNNTHLAAIYLTNYRKNIGSLGSGLTHVTEAPPGGSD